MRNFPLMALCRRWKKFLVLGAFQLWGLGIRDDQPATGISHRLFLEAADLSDVHDLEVLDRSRHQMFLMSRIKKASSTVTSLGISMQGFQAEHGGW